MKYQVTIREMPGNPLSCRWSAETSFNFTYGQFVAYGCTKQEAIENITNRLKNYLSKPETITIEI